MRRITISVLVLSLTLAAAVFAQTSGKVFLTTSDYVSGNTASFEVSTNSFSDNLLGHNQDAYVRTFGKRVFIIEGGDNSNIIAVDPDKPGTPLWQYSVGTGSNPHDLVFVQTAGMLKGYVLRYNKPALWVVNLDAKKAEEFKIGEIDLSAWKDADGSPEAHIGCLAGGYVYVALQRYDLTTFSAGEGVLVKIDPATDKVIDTDASKNGVQGITLAKKNPVAGSLVGTTLYLAGTTYGMSDEGVWSVDLSGPPYAQKVIVTEKTLGSNVAGLYVASRDYGVVSTYNDAWEMVPRAFNPSTGQILDPLPVPDAGGGMVLADGFLYVGSRNKTNPGLYILRPGDNKTAVRFHPTSLPPLTIAYAGESVPTAVENGETAPSEFTVERPFPNPFNPVTTVSFTLSRGSHVVASVYSATGQKVATLADSPMTAGRHSVVWRADGMSSGVWFVRVSDGRTVKTVRAVLVK